MCRKTLEGICGAHKVAERTLASSLKKMKEAGLIDARLFEWSDLLRIAGNEAAHGVGLSIAQPDAKDILEFTNAILAYLFSFRDRFEQFKQRRTPQPSLSTFAVRACRPTGVPGCGPTCQVTRSSSRLG